MPAAHAANEGRIKLSFEASPGKYDLHMSRLLSFLPYPVNNPAKSLQEFLKKLGVIGVGQRTVYVLVQPACGLIFDQGVSGRGKPLENTMFI